MAIPLCAQTKIESGFLGSLGSGCSSVEPMVMGCVCRQSFGFGFAGHALQHESPRSEATAVPLKRGDSLTLVLYGHVNENISKSCQQKVV
eukprot:3461006-Amphidinium_carterae.1